jgi:glycosyltransferase involved in cell wall biosynthesis
MKINSNNHPLVSIIMNCYNGQSYLSESVRSILDQTYKNFEVIFWDNRSIDNSANIYKSFKDKRLKYYYAKKHTSLYEARNFAISKSRGEFISFLDTDDFWTKDKILLQIKKFKNEKVGLVYSNYFVLNQKTGIKKKKYEKKLPKGIVFNELLKDYFIGINTVIVRRSILLKEKKIFNKRFNIIGDFDLFMRLSKNNHFASVNRPIAVYRIHKKNFSKNNYKMYISELKFWLNHQKLISKHNFFYLKERILYLEAIENILNKKFIFSLKKIFRLFDLKKKIKLLILLFLKLFSINIKK